MVKDPIYGTDVRGQTIAVAGKGGTGKTTVAALLIRYLVEHQPRPVLAVDADPNSNLHLLLGLELHGTLGDVREEVLHQIQSGGPYALGMPKSDYLAYQLAATLTEGERVDLLAMGRPEGAGCYCATNYTLRQCLDRLLGSYTYVVMDNEAGLEHLSRQTTRDVDLLLIVTDPGLRGLLAAERIVGVLDELKTAVGRTCLVVNRVPDALSSAFRQRAEQLGLPIVGLLPEDPAVTELDTQGRPLAELDRDSAIYRAVMDMARQLHLISSSGDGQNHEVTS